MSSFKANRGIALLISPVGHLTRCHCVRVRKNISLIKIAKTKDVCSGQCENCWRCSPVKTHIWLWCKSSSASNTLKPITETHRRDEGEASSLSSSYLLTLRASLFPGNRVEVSESRDVPNVSFSSSSSGCGFIVIGILWFAVMAESMAWLAVVHGVFCAQEQAKWALRLWQCGTFQAQLNRKGKSTWMHMQISEHTVVPQKKSKKYTVNPRTCSFSSLTCTNTAWHTVFLAWQFT